MNCVAVNEMNFLLLVFAFLMSLIGLVAIWCSFRIFSLLKVMDVGSEKVA